MRAVRSSVLAVAAIFLAAGSVLADTTPPQITPNVVGTLGNNGWYVSDVSLTWTVTDPESGIISSAGCGAVSITSDTLNTYTCSASSLGGVSSVSTTVGRDTTGPVIVGAGNLGTYEVHQTIAIFCNASDPLSGVASTSCEPITGTAISFPIETPVTYTFSATDNAGNTSSTPVTFTVVVTYNGLAALVDQLVVKPSLDRGLQKLLFLARDAEALGDLVARDRYLDHFSDRVRRNSNRELSAADAQLILTLVGYL